MKNSVHNLTLNSAQDIINQFDIKTDKTLLSCEQLGGGTKNKNYILQLEHANYFLRCRHHSFCDENDIRFEHELMEHLHRKGVLAPYPIKTNLGNIYLHWHDQIYELFDYIESNDSYHQHDLDQLKNAGKALGQFHQAVEDFHPSVEKKRFRIDPPEKAEERVIHLVNQSEDSDAKAIGEYILRQIQKVKSRLPDQLFFRLPSLFIHGDFHPANVKYRGKEIAGFFDLDWASCQPRLQDITYGLLYFVALREADIDGGNIYSLTQTCKPDFERSLLFLREYLKFIKLQFEEVELIPIFMRINWICCRTDGSFKVPPDEQWHFFSSGIEQPLLWLDQHETRFVQSIKEIL